MDTPTQHTVRTVPRNIINGLCADLGLDPEAVGGLSITADYVTATLYDPPLFAGSEPRRRVLLITVVDD